MLEHEKPWSPLSVSDVALLFKDANFPWWFAGGVAIELAVGRTIRKHADIDLLILRRDHLSGRNYLRDWDCLAADPPGELRFWPVGNALDEAVNDVWCRKSSEDHWRFQLMLDDSADDHWVSRRNPQIRAPIQSITKTTASGIPYLAPHVLLFYKAKNPRKKDNIDMDAVLQSGLDIDVPWLRNAISATYGSNHPWLECLAHN